MSPLTPTLSVALPAAWFGITPHVSYYMFRGNEQKNKADQADSTSDCSAEAERRYFMYTAYGPILLVVLVILNSVCTSKQPIRTRYLGHVTGYHPIRDQYLFREMFPSTLPKPHVIFLNPSDKL